MAHPLFTPAEDAEIIRLRETESLSWAEIARQIGRPSGWCVSFRYNRVLRPVGKSAPGPQAKERPCMRCRAVFFSPHNGVRHCDSCRGDLSGGVAEINLGHQLRLRALNTAIA